MGKWILPYLKQYRGLFILAIFFWAITILCGAGLMFTSGYLISEAATRPESILMVYVPIVAVRTFGIGRAVLSYIQRLIGHQFVLKILSGMRVRLYKVIEPQALFLRSRFPSGDILGTLCDDIENLQNFYLKTLFPSIVSLFIYAAVIIGAGVFSLPFAFLLAVLIGILVLVGPLISYYYTKVKNENVRQGRHLLYRQFTDAVFGISDWIFSGRHLELIRRHEEQQKQTQFFEKKIHSFGNWRAVVNQMIVGMVVICAIYWTSGMSRGGGISPTFIAAVGLVAMSLLESFLPISDAVSDLTVYQASINRLNSMESTLKKKDHLDPINFSTVSVELKDVSYQYPSGPLLLNRFSLKVEQGEKIAILGPSGAGKSTLLKLLLGVLEPSGGKVLLNGSEASDVSASIHKMIAVLNQKPYLFHTSVINNIRLGNPEASDEEVYEAAERVGLHQMIMGLPNGFDTNMLETGQRFSGGERQRIALARILLQKTPVVIMDEPTVGLDPMTEKQLLTTVFTTLSEKTIIWVSHHLAGLEKMNEIIFLDDGVITMSGTHQQLLEKEERYRRLFALDRPFFR